MLVLKLPTLLLLLKQFFFFFSSDSLYIFLVFSVNCDVAVPYAIFVFDALFVFGVVVLLVVVIYAFCGGHDK